MKGTSSYEETFINYLDNKHSMLYRAMVIKEARWDAIFGRTIPKGHWSRRVDFYFPKIDLIIEIHGEQHYRLGFDKDEAAIDQLVNRRKRDSDLGVVCGENGITLVELEYSIFDAEETELYSLLNSRIYEAMGVNSHG